MDEALYACRFVQFTAAMLIFGTAAFRVYALADSDTRTASRILAEFDAWFGHVALAAALVALISAMALVPCQAAAMAGSTAAAVDFAGKLGLQLDALTNLGARIDAARAKSDPVSLASAARDLHEDIELLLERPAPEPVRERHMRWSLLRQETAGGPTGRSRRGHIAMRLRPAEGAGS